MLPEASFCPLQAVLHRIGHLSDGTLHLIHADVLVEILQNIVDSTLFGYIALNIGLLHLNGISATTNEMSEDVLRCLIGQMTVTEHLVLGLDLIFEEA